MTEIPTPRAPEFWTEFPPEEPGVYQERVLQLIDRFQAHLEDEFGKFTTNPVPDSQRVILVPEEATHPEEWMVCYLSDPSADARLVVDDYVPDVTAQTENLPDDV